MKSPAGYVAALLEGKRLHQLFCLGLLLVFTLIAYGRHDSTLLLGLLFTYLYVLAGVYTGRWICRRWFLTARWAGLLIVVLLSILIFAMTGLAGVYFLFVRVSLHHIGESLLDAVTVSGLLLFAGFFIAVTRSAIREKMNVLVLAEQQKTAELHLLRSQVSPHFLFNTLNNLYSLAINRPAQMPELLLQLSELLRYSVYEADQPFVGLRDELDYVRNYAALESIRVADRLQLRWKLDTIPQEARIAPLLLIVLVENAFKHSKETLTQQILIEISLKITAEKICFTVMNSCGEQKEIAESRCSGFGLDNMIKRLELLYLGAYRLQQERRKGFFTITLELDHK